MPRRRRRPERSRGEAREARHGALIGRARSHGASTMCLLSIHNCDPRVISEYLLAQPPAATRRGGPRRRRERRRRTSRRGEKTESVSREEETKKEEEGGRERRWWRESENMRSPDAGRPVAGPRQGDALRRRPRSLALLPRGRKSGTTEFPQRRRVGRRPSPLVVRCSLQVRSFIVLRYCARNRSRRDVGSLNDDAVRGHRARDTHTHTHIHTYTCTSERDSQTHTHGATSWCPGAH